MNTLYDECTLTCLCGISHGRAPRGVTSIPSVLQSATAIKVQVNGQGSFKAKDNGQTFLVDGSKLVASARKYNKNTQSKVKGQDKILAKVNCQS